MLNPPIPKRKVPLLLAAQILADICDVIDETPDELDRALVEAFDNAALDLSEAIDRRKSLMWVIDGQLKAARGARAEIDAHVQKLKRIQERVKEKTRESMAAHPDLPWKDSTGRKLSLVNNSQPSLEFAFDLKDTRTFTGVLHEETIKMFDIPAKYLKTATVTLLNTEAIKADLAAGEKIMWAELKHGNHVRGLMPKKTEIESDDE